MAPNRDINQIVKSDDLGSIFQKNKRLIGLLLVLIVVGVIGAGFYSQFSDESKTEYNSLIFKFEQGPMKTFMDSGTDSQALLASFKELHKTVKNYSGLFPIVIKLSDNLVARKNLNEALEVLTIGQTLSSNEYNIYFVMARLAVVYEDLGQDQKAIDTLLSMNSSKLKIFEGKNYLDLGRIYLKQGLKDKAKVSFQYVVDKAHDEAEFVKIAKLYLAKI